jgi:hypothetical protein
MSAHERLVAALRGHALVIGEVTLTSGAKAQYLIDARRAILRPDGFTALSELVADRARALGATADCPPRATRAPLRPFYRCAAAVVSRGRILMHRRETGWLSGMWELPGEEADRLGDARKRFRRRFPTASPWPVAVIEQPIAGRRVRVEVYRTPGAPPGARDRWMTASAIEGSASPSLTKKIVRRIVPDPSGRRTISK